MTVRIKLNRLAVRQLLRGREMQAELKQRAQRIADAAGPGHDVVTFAGRTRARATVRTVTDEAKLAQQHHQNLTNAIRAGK